MKKMNFFLLLVFWVVVCSAICFGIGVGITYLQTEGDFNIDMMKSSLSLGMLVAGVALGFAITLYIKFFKKGKGPKTVKGKTAAGKEFELHYDSGFMARDEVLNDKFLINQTWSSLPSLKKTGSFIMGIKNGPRYETTMKDEMHSLIIGTTGTGKTTMLIDPAIRVYAHTQEKPSLVITDPKGELYEKHARALLEEGYDVKVYDLNNPYASSRWNPMERAFNIYHRAINIYKEAKKYSGCTPQQAGKEPLEGVVYGDVWYEFEDIAFPDEESLNKQLASKRQQLINEASFDLRGVAASICPVSAGTNDTMWEQGAQDFLYGIMLAMLEDSIDPRLGDNKLRKDQFNFYNLYKISNKRDPDPDNPFNSIRRYCSGRAKTSNVPLMTSPIINSAPTTTKSYLSVLASKVSQLMEDMGICYATSGTEIDFNNFIDKPTAFFIKVPDHKKERHPLATICVAQLYRTLVDIANKYPRMQLPRHVYFIMDEFGNLPVIQDFGTMITVARSRNILFNIVVQSFTQLDTKYGKEVAETLKGNFNIQIFLGSEDAATREAFSKSCGDIQLTTEEEQVTKNEGKDSSSTSRSTNVQRSVRPLVDPFELSTLPTGTAIVKIFRYRPIKCELTPYYKTPQIVLYPPLTASKTIRSLNEEQVFYDIEKRNQIIANRQY